MRIEVEVSEAEIVERAKEIAANRLADRIIKSEYGDGYFYRKEIKAAIREVIRGDIENLSNRAVEAASKSIENRAVKKLLERLEDDRK